MVLIVSKWRLWTRTLRDRWWLMNRCWCPLECGWELGRSMLSLHIEGWCWWGWIEGLKGGLSFSCIWKSKVVSQCFTQILMDNLKKHNKQIKKNSSASDQQFNCLVGLPHVYKHYSCLFLWILSLNAGHIFQGLLGIFQGHFCIKDNHMTIYSQSITLKNNLIETCGALWFL